jgi:hypothetical protein
VLDVVCVGFNEIQVLLPVFLVGDQKYVLEVFYQGVLSPIEEEFGLEILSQTDIHTLEID